MASLFSSNQLSLELLKKAVDSTNEGVTVADLSLPDQPLIYVNKAFEKMTGYTQEESLGKSCRFLQGNERNQPELATIREAIATRTSCRVVLRNFKKDGTLFWNELSLAPLADPDGSSHFFIGIQRDVSEETSQRETINYLIEHDALTDLYNYRGFFSRVSKLIQSFKNSSLYFGVGVVDIDFFKKINDEFGHVRGNNVLRSLADEFTNRFSKGNIIARLGGDEFFFAAVQNDHDTSWFNDKIQECVQQVNSCMIDNAKISLSAGYALEKCNQKIQIEHMICKADELMYKQKQENHVLYYSKNNRIL